MSLVAESREPRAEGRGRASVGPVDEGGLIREEVTTDSGRVLEIYRDPEIGGTVATMFWHRVERFGYRTALREKDLGIWQTVTWRELGERARQCGMALRSLGFSKGDVACVLSNTVPEWLYADLGILGVGGVSAGIYPTDAAAQVEYLLDDSRCRVVFVEDEEQLDKVLEVRERCPALERIVIFDMEGLRDFDDQQAMNWESFLALGREHDRAHPGAWEECLALAAPEDLAILVYTSGTTGPPKGAMISHHNIVFQCTNGPRVLPQGEDDERLAFLPLCHIAERLFVYISLYRGVKLNFVENPETVPENAQEVQPTVFFAVPRVWEKLYSGIRIALSDATAFERWAYERAIAIGYRRAEKRLAGEPSGLFLELVFRCAYWLVLRNVRRFMGIDRCRWIGTGAAPIAPDLIRWYLALGIDMVEGYGQTENTGIAAITTPDRIEPGTVGRCVPYAEARISAEGEILLRGEHVFMGYLNKPERTAEAIRDGWLHTGDVGSIDEAGYLKITDRMKDIIITAGGKNITPSEIENQLKFSPYIADAVVIGDRRRYLACLIMIDHENVVKYAQDHHVPFTNYSSLCAATEVVELIQGVVDEVNARFARVEQIKKFRLIDQELTPEDDELTPTMKLKRKFVNEKYRDLIESMY
jgi:long-chain acyl-CoA synthetase